MPKVSVPLKRFDGGLNNRDSARDIGDNFLAEATNVDVSSVGRIRTLGEFKDLASSITLNISGKQFPYGQTISSRLSDSTLFQHTGPLRVRPAIPI